MQEVMQRVPTLHQLPTATSRAMRDGEQEGREHYFVSEARFREMIADGDLLEWQEVHGRLYGMMREAVEAAFDRGDMLIADIEMYGADYARQQYPDNVVSVYIQPPSVQALIDRMRARGDSETEIGKRLMRVPKELDYAARCDYVVVNDDFEQAAEALYAVVIAEHNRKMVAVRRERGELSYTFSYLVEVIPLYGGELLVRAGGAPLFPASALLRDMLPHQEALQLIERELNIAPDEGQLITGGAPDGSFVPPLALTNHPTITFVYGYRLPERITPPGWTWMPIDQIDQLPPALLSALPAIEGKTTHAP
jgi:guanylate kinase